MNREPEDPKYLREALDGTKEALKETMARELALEAKLKLADRLLKRWQALQKVAGWHRFAQINADTQHFFDTRDR
jgi:hypothetical protein